MKEQAGFPEDLVRENSKLRQRVAELESSQASWKLVEKALIESEFMFRTLVERSVFGVYLMHDNSFRYVNRKFAEIFGYDVDKLIDGIDVRTLVHEDDLPLFQESVRKRNSGEAESIHYQLRCKRKDQTLIHVEVYGSRIEFEGCPSIIGSLVDVSARVRAEKALRASENLYRSLLDTMGESFGIQDANGTITYVNDRMCDLWGYDREELIGRSVPEFVDDVDHQTLLSNLSRRRLGHQASYEIVWKGRGGRSIHTKVSPKPVFDDDDNYVGSFAVITDLTEIKTLHATLDIERRKFKLLCENLPYGVLLIGKNGQFLYANPAFRQITGYGIEDVPSGKEWFNRAFPDRALREEVVSLWKEDLQSSMPEAARPRTFQVRCGDGSDKAIHFRPVQLANGDHVMTCEDVTQRKREREELVEAKNAAEAADRAKGEFLANMSHELRTPLNSIIGFAEILEDQLFGQLNETQAKHVRHIGASGRHLLQLVTQILDLSKIQSGRAEIELSQVNVRDVLENSLSIMREQALARDLSVELTVGAEDGGLTVLADELKLKQVMLNLLSNAIKFTPEGGNIRVEAWLIEGELVISVYDTGAGIDPSDNSRIFRAFEQVDSTLSRQHQGTGLGLPLARELVEMHGGRIWMESEGVGKGSTFRFAIPLKDRQ